MYQITDYRYEKNVNGEVVPFEFEGLKYRCISSALSACTLVKELMRGYISPLSAIEAEEQIGEYIKDFGTNFVNNELKKKNIQPILWARFGADDELRQKLFDWLDSEAILEEDVPNDLTDLRIFQQDFLKNYEIENAPLFSLGYGDSTFDELVSILKKYKINYVLDVRGDRRSHNSAFSNNSLKSKLEYHGISYSYIKKLADLPMGEENVFDSEGFLNYPLFWNEDKEEKLLEIANKTIEQGKKVVFLSAKRNPTECHRGKLLGRKLQDNGIELIHILKDGLKKQSDLVIEDPSRSFENFWVYSPQCKEQMGKIRSLADRILSNEECPMDILSTKKILTIIKELGKML